MLFIDIFCQCLSCRINTFLVKKVKNLTKIPVYYSFTNVNLLK